MRRPGIGQVGRNEWESMKGRGLAGVQVCSSLAFDWDERCSVRGGGLGAWVRLRLGGVCGMHRGGQFGAWGEQVKETAKVKEARAKATE